MPRCGSTATKSVRSTRIGKSRIVVAALSDLSIGMIRLPRHHVEIFLTDCGVEETRRFLARFELHFRRAGG